MNAMQAPPERFFNEEEFVPELRQIFQERPLNPKKIILVAMKVKDPDKEQGLVPAEQPRSQIALTDGREFWFWDVDSLCSLFRGNRQPPVLGDYPEAYNDSFILFDLHVLEISKLVGVPRDAEMRELFATLRRRPDGRSLGVIHDYLWQAAALILGTRPLSQAEFEAILARLERSCRTFEMGPTSRNYIDSLQATLGQAFR